MRVNDQYDINEFIMQQRHRSNDEIVRLLVSSGTCSATETLSAEEVAVRYFNAVRGMVYELRRLDAKLKETSEAYDANLEELCRVSAKLAEVEQTAAALFVKAAGAVVC